MDPATIEKSWQTVHGSGTFRVWEVPLEGWYFRVDFVHGSTQRGPYKTRLGADRAAWNLIKRWEADAARAAE